MCARTHICSVSEGRTACYSTVAKHKILVTSSSEESTHLELGSPALPVPLGSQNVKVPGEEGLPAANQTLVSSGLEAGPFAEVALGLFSSF